MENKLEQLLNSLIEKGWKPYGMKCTEAEIDYEGITRVVFSDGLVYFRRSLRELVSKESGLWQFVCENGMVKNPDKYWKRYRELTISDGIVYMSGEYEYRIIESALKDESKLEDFLLRNIKVEGQQKN